MSPFSYPATVEVDTAGFHLVTFPDVPEAGTDAQTREEALREAADALIAALGGYIHGRRPIPKPSKAKAGQVMITLPTLVMAKLALYEAVREAGISNVELGRRLGINESAVRRLLDLDHRSHIGQVEAGLQVLGHRLVVDVQAAGLHLPMEHKLLDCTDLTCTLWTHLPEL
jgi:antitoxin HicB